jgi:hypothetical protein
MSLSRFAILAGATPRWVQNAFQALDRKAVYHENEAKVLGLARILQESFGLPLVVAHPLALEALGAWPTVRVWRRESPTGAVVMEVDLERYLSGYASRLALARSHEERRRGRPPSGRKRGIGAALEHAVEYAVEYGVDVGLLESSLRRTPEERLRRLDEDVAFLETMRVEPR